MGGTTSHYCWYVESDTFQIGKKIMVSEKNDCCSSVTIEMSSDGHLFAFDPRTDSSNRYCITVDGMPHQTLTDINGKELKLAGANDRGNNNF